MAINDPTNGSDDDPFWSIRGKAIQAYAVLEQSLCGLLATLGEMEVPVAATIFFEIRNFRSITFVLGRLLRRRHGDTYLDFWKSFSERIGRITTLRNYIVHWNVVHVIGDGTRDIQLSPPNFWDLRFENRPPLKAADFIDFIERCHFFSRLCNMFRLYLGPRFSQEVESAHKRTWHDIFLHKVVYPPPVGHPLFQKPQEPESPPPPSQESPQPEKPPGA